MTMKPHRGGQRFRRQVRQRQRLGLGVGERAVRQGDPAHGRAGEPAQHLPVEHPGPADLVRGARHRGRLARPPRRRRPDGGDEPADLGQGRRRDRARRLSVLRLDQPLPRVEVPRSDIIVHRHAAHRDLQRDVQDPRQRQLFKNIIYVGALAGAARHRPGRDREAASASSTRARRSCSSANVKALDLGRDYARANLPCRSASRSSAARPGRRPHLRRRQQRRGAGLRLWRRDGLRLVSDHAVVVGGRGLRQATAASCRVDAETGSQRYAIVQAEDELASIGMVIGAGWNGARAFTATSGPGISLMTEFIGLAYFAEIPAVLFNVQRGGPSTGMPTRTQQADVLSCAYASHGDTKHVLLFPEDPTECFEMSRPQALRPRRPPADAGLRPDRPRHRHERAAVPSRSPGTTARSYDRGKVMTARGARGRHAISAAISTSTATASPTAPIPGTHPTRGSLLHARHEQRPLRPLHRGRRRLRRQHAAAAAQVRDGQGAACPRR